jgi:hypothetical protein
MAQTANIAPKTAQLATLRDICIKCSLEDPLPLVRILAV